MIAIAMILQPSIEVDYLIASLEECPITVHKHYNHIIKNSSTIKLESELQLADYKENKVQLIFNPETYEYTALPMRKLEKFEEKDQFIIWYEREHKDVFGRMIYTSMVKDLEHFPSSSSRSFVKVADFDVISRANYHYFLTL